MDPPVWVPSANGTQRAATAAPDPLLDPPGVRWWRQGLRVGEGSAEANWVVTVLPRTIAPAARSRATLNASSTDTLSASGGKPAGGGGPPGRVKSFSPPGKPWGGPS